MWAEQSLIYLQNIVDILRYASADFVIFRFKAYKPWSVI